jgi:hypothetical protein
MIIIEDAKPLQWLPTGGFYDKYVVRLEEAEVNLWETWNGQKLDFENKKIIFSIKAIPKLFCRFNTLMDVTGSGAGELYHKRMIEKMQQVCPDDFQAFSVTLVNNAKSKEQFENHDFYVLNVLHQVDFLDEEKSVFRHWTFSDGTPTTDLEQARYHDDRWNGHLIVRDRISMRVLWHPKLAAEFAKYKDIAFYTDEELIAARLG